MKFIEYLKQPLTIWKLVFGAFIVGVARTTLQNNIATNNERLDKFESMKIDVTIMQMQTDIAWIRQSLEK